MHATSDYTNASRVLYRGHCLVYNVHLAADGAQADCQVYDGVNAQGKLRAHIEALSGTSFDWDPDKGVHFDFGIYIAVNANTSKVTVTYEPLAKDEIAEQEQIHQT